MVLLRISVPRGRTALSASSNPEAEPVASTTTSNSRGCQSLSWIVRTPAFLIKASLSACLPSALIFAPVSRRAWAHKIAELAVAEHQHLVAGIELDLSENFESRGQRLGKYRFFVADVFRNAMKIVDGHRNQFGERAVGVENPHHGPLRTMAAEIAPASLASPAAEVDLANHAPADELGRPFNYRTDEFMAGHAFEAHVAFEDLQIGGANAGEVDFD